MSGNSFNLEDSKMLLLGTELSWPVNCLILDQSNILVFGKELTDYYSLEFDIKNDEYLVQSAEWLLNVSVL